MSDAEFFAKLSPKRLASLEEDHKAERKEYLAAAKRFAQFGTNNKKLADLMASGQVMPAADLVRVREDQEAAAKAFEASVADEVNNQKSKRPGSIAPPVQAYSRESFED